MKKNRKKWVDLTTEQKVERMRFEQQNTVFGINFVFWGFFSLLIVFFLLAFFVLDKETALDLAVDVLKIGNFFFWLGFAFIVVTSILYFKNRGELTKKENEGL